MASKPSTVQTVVASKTLNRVSGKGFGRRLPASVESMKDPASLSKVISDLHNEMDDVERSIGSLPFVGGVLIQRVSVLANTLVLVKHGLGRAYVGYEITRKSVAIDAYEPTWQPNTAYTASTSFVLPSRRGSFIFQCTANGTSAAAGSEPAWPTVGGTLVSDNTTQWIALPSDPEVYCPLIFTVDGVVDLYLH